MVPKINPAYRLYQIISRAESTHQDNQQTLGVWAHVFQLSENEKTRREFQVTGGLGLLFHELELTKTMMAETEFTESLYLPSLDAIQNVLSLQLLSNPWSSVRNTLGQRVVNDLRWCSEVLPSEEELVSEDELGNLLSDLADLEKSIQNTDLPVAFVSLVMKHIDAIRNAIKWYPITGEKGLKTEIHKAYGEVQSNKVVIESVNSDSPPKSKFVRVWAKFMAIVKKAERLSDTAERISNLASAGKRVVDLFVEFTSIGSSGGSNFPPGGIV